MKTSKNITTIAALALALALTAMAPPASAQSAAADVESPVIAWERPIVEGGAVRMRRALRIRLLRALGHPGAHLMRNPLQVRLLAKYGAAGASIASILFPAADDSQRFVAERADRSAKSFSARVR